MQKTSVNSTYTPKWLCSASDGAYTASNTEFEDMSQKCMPAAARSFKHDNARSNIARMSKAKLMKFGWTILPHPPYSPDLAPSYYHLFSYLQRHLGGQDFQTRDDIKKTLEQCFKEKSPAFWSKGIYDLPKRWQKIPSSLIVGMRLLLLVLLLAVWVNCAIADDFGQRIKKVFGKIKTALNATTLQRVHEKFKKFGEKLKAKLTLSPEQQARLQELLKKIVPIKKDHVQKDGDSIEEINTKKKIGEFLFQSDIVLTEEQANEIVDVDNSGNRTKRQAFRDGNYPRTIWSTGVNFFFDPSAGPDIQRIFKKGAALWQKDTCIDFRMDNRAPNRIRVFREDGCWSFVGNLNRQQDLSLGEGCETVGIAAHEIGHALGFFHTQSRHDRDDFIVFNPRNVKPDWLDQFTKETENTNYNYGLPYDYGNIMHYGASSSSVNGEVTMMPKDPKYIETLGSPFVSFYELLMLNAHYRCLERCDKATSAKCMMGGFPHPRDCSRCVCPSGYGGRLCNERPPGCGGTLEAKPQYQVLFDEVGDAKAGKQAREDMTTCTYWIRAPVGSRIEVKIADLSRGLAVDGCTYWGVEIKTHADQRLTGYRFCAPEDVGVTLVSKFHVVPIVAYNRFYATQFKLQYRIAPQRG
ncbi:hypothetical protein RB195_004358 [Necator americanus]|uniref:Metalloendopeptidase n=2 Tax=Necator americanus TaxID=51031 RepID=A0ABR1BKW8_NECAM